MSPLHPHRRHVATGNLAAALNAAFRGWFVLPLRAGEKRPLAHGPDHCPRVGICADEHRGWEAHATRDLAAVEAHWSAHPNHGVGIATGPSGLVVVDLDTPKPGDRPPAGAWATTSARCGTDVLRILAERAGAAVPPTYLVRTGRGGWHLYYAAPPDIRLTNSGRTLGPWIDTRAWGGQVVAAGTSVAGRPYTLTRDIPPTPLPAWLIQPLRRPAPSLARARAARVPADRCGAYLAAAIRRQVGFVTAAPDGDRNNALFRAAVALGQLVAGGALSAADVTAELKQGAAGHIAAGAFSDRQALTTIASGLRAGAKRPERFPHDPGRSSPLPQRAPTRRSTAVSASRL